MEVEVFFNKENPIPAMWLYPIGWSGFHYFPQPLTRCHVSLIIFFSSLFLPHARILLLLPFPPSLFFFFLRSSSHARATHRERERCRETEREREKRDRREREFQRERPKDEIGRVRDEIRRGRTGVPTT